MTTADIASIKLNDISTHTLTWSVTLTDTSTGSVQEHFNSHAHVERDVKKLNQPVKVYISTHTLTWSVTFGLPLFLFSFSFQLTRSRGAWRRHKNMTSHLYYFNSHAHVERDYLLLCHILKVIISTHTLTWSVTGRSKACFVGQGNFNSHAHVERDLGCFWVVLLFS